LLSPMVMVGPNGITATAASAANNAIAGAMR
jgi:hypothetical protein